jgi:DNA-binding GntR family transcriptional regulator
MNHSKLTEVVSNPSEEGRLGEEVNHQTLSDEAVNRLRTAILQGKLKPGERLIQSKLAQELGMSRIPLREALKTLEIEGLIQNESYRGAVVRKFGENDVREIYCLRATLESLAAEIALPNLVEADFDRLQELQNQMEHLVNEEKFKDVAIVGRQFHMVIYAKSGWNRLTDMIGMLWLRRPQVDVFMAQRAVVSLRQHQMILDAARERNSWKLARLIRNHIESAEESLLSQMAQTNDSF